LNEFANEFKKNAQRKREWMSKFLKTLNTHRTVEAGGDGGEQNLKEYEEELGAQLAGMRLITQAWNERNYQQMKLLRKMYRIGPADTLNAKQKEFVGSLQDTRERRWNMEKKIREEIERIVGTRNWPR
jgi:hypothetical protein